MTITLQEIAEKAHCTPLAADLVIKGLRYATGVKGLEGAPSTHVSAKELCEAIKVAAEAYHGLSVSAIFTKAGILRSEDIGRIVFLLIEQGILTRREGEAAADFDGLFETARL